MMNRSLPFFLVLLLTAFHGVAQTPNASVQNNNEQCAGCHQEIYERYKTTPMAHASGAAVDGVIPGEFTHQASGVHYRVFEEKDAAGGETVWLGYSRENAGANRELNGREKLEYFIGSGRRGRTYLFNQDGYWFETPINWYGKKQIWDMAPNYLTATQMPMTLAVDPGCLHCHTTQAAHSLADARNHYAGAPFAESGIACTACHGDAQAHLDSGGKTKMVNIDAMQAVRRDSVCLSCHLEGQTAVVKAGKELVDFKPGDDLFDYALFFVRSSVAGSGGRATSQWEALLKSECKKKSGDKLTCTTCHDPHSTPTAEEKVGFFRAKCLQCHGELANTHHAENQDCAGCHMARSTSTDIAHEQVTDHYIVKHPATGPVTQKVGVELTAVGGFAASDRDLGIAYAHMSRPGDSESPMRAANLLKKAEDETHGAVGDRELHDQLGFLYQANGDAVNAKAEYKMALNADPYDALAAGNLAYIEAQEKNLPEAIKLWSDVVAHHPSETKAAMNLAIVECQTGMRSEAVGTLNRLLSIDPDNSAARGFRAQIVTGHQTCALHP